MKSKSKWDRARAWEEWEKESEKIGVEQHKKKQYALTISFH